MSRQLVGAKKLRAYQVTYGLPIIAVMVRGGTNHRKDLCLEDGSITCLYSDGTLQATEYKHGIEVKN